MGSKKKMGSPFPTNQFHGMTLQVLKAAHYLGMKFVILNEQRAMRPAPTHPGAIVVGTPGGQGAVVGAPVQVPGKLVT